MLKLLSGPYQKMLERFHVKPIGILSALYSHSIVLGGLELMS
jgi:hypothetical protein